MKITGEFQITDWQENVERTFDEGGKLSAAVVNQRYQGDLQGDSVLKYQMVYDSKGDALFIGIETFEGRHNNTECRLIIKHDGAFTGGVANSHFVVVDSVPDKTMVGLKGSFAAQSGGLVKYQID